MDDVTREGRKTSPCTSRGPNKQAPGAPTPAEEVYAGPCAPVSKPNHCSERLDFLDEQLSPTPPPTPAVRNYSELSPVLDSRPPCPPSPSEETTLGCPAARAEWTEACEEKKSDHGAIGASVLRGTEQAPRVFRGSLWPEEETKEDHGRGGIAELAAVPAPAAAAATAATTAGAAFTDRTSSSEEARVAMVAFLWGDDDDRDGEGKSGYRRTKDAEVVRRQVTDVGGLIVSEYNKGSERPRVLGGTRTDIDNPGHTGNHEGGKEIIDCQHDHIGVEAVRPYGGESRDFVRLDDHDHSRPQVRVSSGADNGNSRDHRESTVSGSQEGTQNGDDKPQKQGERWRDEMTSFLFSDYDDDDDDDDDRNVFPRGQPVDIGDNAGGGGGSAATAGRSVVHRAVAPADERHRKVAVACDDSGHGTSGSPAQQLSLTLEARTKRLPEGSNDHVESSRGESRGDGKDGGAAHLSRVGYREDEPQHWRRRFAEREITSFRCNLTDADDHDDDGNSPTHAGNTNASDVRRDSPCDKSRSWGSKFGIPAAGGEHGSSNSAGASLPHGAPNDSIQRHWRSCGDCLSSGGSDDGHQTRGRAGGVFGVVADVREEKGRRDTRKGGKTTSDKMPHGGSRDIDKQASVLARGLILDDRLEGYGTQNTLPSDNSRDVVEDVVTFCTDKAQTEEEVELDGPGMDASTKCASGGGSLAKDHDPDARESNRTRRGRQNGESGVEDPHPRSGTYWHRGDSAMRKWLEVDDEEESNDGAERSTTNRREAGGDHEDRSEATRPRLPEKGTPSRIDYRQRRFSLLSLDNGRESPNPPGISMQHSGGMHLENASNGGRRVASPGSESPSGRPRAMRAGVAERNRGGSRPLMPRSCTEIDSSAAAAKEPILAHVAPPGRRHSHPHLSRITSRRRHVQEQTQPDAGEEPRDTKSAAAVGAWCAVFGRHRGPPGTWKLVRSIQGSSLSEFSTMSDNGGSRSSIEVHNFLDEFVGSSGGDGRSGDPDEVDTRGVGRRGEMRDGHSESAWNGRMRSDHGRSGTDASGLDAKDAGYLIDSENTREVLLAIEELHFDELPIHKQLELVRSLRIVHFSSEQVVYEEGDLSDSLYFMLGRTEDPGGEQAASEGAELTVETCGDGDEGRDGDADEDEHERKPFPYMPAKRFFGEEGLVYSKEHRRSATVRAAVDLRLAVLDWTSFALWQDFRLYLLMKEVSLLAKLPASAQTAVLRALKYADYKPGQLIIREGETGDKFYMITHGTVAVLANDTVSQLSCESWSGSSIDVDCGYMGVGGNAKGRRVCDEDDIKDEATLRSRMAGQHEWPSRSERCSSNGDGESGDSDVSSTWKGRHVSSPAGREMVFVPRPGQPAPQKRMGSRLWSKREVHACGDLLRGGIAGGNGLSNTTLAAGSDEGGISKSSVETAGVVSLGRGEDRSPAALADGDKGSDPVAGLIAASSEGSASKDCRPSDPSQSTEQEETSCTSSSRDERVLTRLYEGNCFGEMALIYDEPRNASVRALTDVTCVYLHKAAFRRCLCDKAFNKLMEQAALQTACYREQRGTATARMGEEHTGSGEVGLSSPRYGARPWTDFAGARALATARAGIRSSFRSTGRLKFGEDAEGCAHGRVINDYRVHEKVGEGSFGAVFKVVHVHSGEVSAMKVITKPRNRGQKRDLLEQNLRREVAVMKFLRHPNVVTLREFIDDPRSHKVYMIQEFMAEGGLLEEAYEVDPFPEQVAFPRFIQAARGLQFIHSFGVCHGDVKPSNILQDADGRVKIGDFGACVILNPDDEGDDGDISSSEPSEESYRRKRCRKKREQRVGGTPSFHAPELFGEGGVSRMSFASDLWALGITLYQMVVGRLPFFGRSYTTLKAAITMEGLSFPSNCQLEPHLVNLLHRMLDKNPKTRITLEETLHHEWVTKEGVCPPQPETGRAGRAPDGTDVTVPKVAGSRNEITHRAAAPSLVQHFAGGSGTAGRTDDVTGTTNGPRRHTLGGAPTRRRASPLQRWSPRGEDDGADGIAASSPVQPLATPPADRATCPRSSSLSSKGLLAPGEGDRRHREQTQQPRQLDGKWGRSSGDEGRRGESRFGREGAATRCRRENEDENEECADVTVWSGDDDGLATPRMLEDVVDKSRSFIPQGMALHALTVTLPEESVGMSEGRLSEGAGETGQEGPKPFVSSRPSTPASAHATGSPPPKGGNARQQERPKASATATFNGEAAGRRTQCQVLCSTPTPSPPPLSTAPSPALSSTATASEKAAPLSSTLAVAGDSTATAEKETQDERGYGNIVLALPVADTYAGIAAAPAAAARGESNCRRSETGQHADTDALPLEQSPVSSEHTAQPRIGDGAPSDPVASNTTGAPVSPQEQQLHTSKGKLREQRSQTPFMYHLSASSVFRGTQSDPRRHSQEDGVATGGGGGGADVIRGSGGRAGIGWSCRNICSCPTIGATFDGPLIARHELTDRSALERSLRLVRKPDFLMLSATPALAPNQRVMISSLKAVSSLRASAEGEIGSRCPSVANRSAKQESRETCAEARVWGIEQPTTREGSPPSFRPKDGGGVTHSPSGAATTAATRTASSTALAAEQSTAFRSAPQHSSSPGEERRNPTGVPSGSTVKSDKIAQGAPRGCLRRRGEGLSSLGTNVSDLSWGESIVESGGESSVAEQSDAFAHAATPTSISPSWNQAVATAAPTLEKDGLGGSGLGLAEYSSDFWGGECGSGGGGIGGGDGQAGMGRKTASSRSALLCGVDEEMGCIDEEEPSQHDTRGTISDGSVGIRNAHDPAVNTWASFASLTCGSGPESGSCGGGGWRNGAGPATRETEIGGRSYQIICAQAAGVGADSGGEDGGRGAGIEGGGSLRGGAGRNGGSKDGSCSSDGMGDTTSVADITECFESIDDAMVVEDPELRVVSSEEILALTSGGSRRTSGSGRDRKSFSRKSAGGSYSSGSIGTTSTNAGTGSSAKLEDTTLGHVQARAWAGQVNIDARVRFGVSLAQGKRCFMEDTAACLTDAFGVCPGRARVSTSAGDSKGNSSSNSSSNSNTGTDLPSAELPKKPVPMVPEEKAAATRAAGAAAPPRPVPPACASERGGTSVLEPTGAGAAESNAAETAAAGAFANAAVAAKTAVLTAPEAAAYFGVFDGHGGSGVAMRLQDVLHLRVLNSPHFPSDIPEAIRAGCLAMDLECLENCDGQRQMDTEEIIDPHLECTLLKTRKTAQVFSGAVGVIAIVYRPPAFLPEAMEATPETSAVVAEQQVSPPPPQGQEQRRHSRHRFGSGGHEPSLTRQKQQQPTFLHVANVGDCRAVLCRGGTAIALTEDHTPSLPSEAARVEAAGGFVSRGRVNGILGVSRSFGDVHCKVYPPHEGNGLWDEQQVISRPEVHSFQLTEEDSFLILACDGVWDVFSNQEAVSYVHRRLLTHRDVQRAAVELIDKALVTSGDNCSCIVICLNQVVAPKKRRHSRRSSLKKSPKRRSNDGTHGSLAGV